MVMFNSSRRLRIHANHEANEVAGPQSEKYGGPEDYENILGIGLTKCMTEALYGS